MRVTLTEVGQAELQAEQQTSRNVRHWRRWRRSPQSPAAPVAHEVCASTERLSLTRERSMLLLWRIELLLGHEGITLVIFSGADATAAGASAAPIWSCGCVLAHSTVA
jgi:hypothetical protein